MFTFFYFLQVLGFVLFVLASLMGIFTVYIWARNTVQAKKLEKAQAEKAARAEAFWKSITIECIEPEHFEN